MKRLLVAVLLLAVLGGAVVLAVRDEATMPAGAERGDAGHGSHG